MQVIFDNMAAFFALTGTILIFAMIQIRGTLTASEAVIHNMVYSDMVSFSEYLQVDLSNIRTQTQTEDAISAGNFSGGAAYACGITKTGDVTTMLTFPTLADPLNSYSTSTPEDAQIVLVNYVLTDTGETITIPKGSTEETVPLYTIERMVDTKSTGTSNKMVTHFLVEFLNRGGTDFSSSTANCTSDLSKIRFELKFATDGVEYATQDQKSTSQSNVTRFGATVIPANLE